MNDLLAVHILKCVAYLAYDFLAKPAVDIPSLYELFQGASVHPFHHDAVADRRMLNLRIILAHAAVAEGKSDVKIFAQQFLYMRLPLCCFFRALWTKNRPSLQIRYSSLNPSSDEWMSSRLLESIFECSDPLAAKNPDGPNMSAL